MNESRTAAANEAVRKNPYRVYLREDQIPTQYYNLRADMPEAPEPMRLPDLSRQK